MMPMNAAPSSAAGTAGLASRTALLTAETFLFETFLDFFFDSFVEKPELAQEHTEQRKRAGALNSPAKRQFVLMSPFPFSLVFPSKTTMYQRTSQFP